MAESRVHHMPKFLMKKQQQLRNKQADINEPYTYT